MGVLLSTDVVQHYYSWVPFQLQMRFKWIEPLVVLNTVRIKVDGVNGKTKTELTCASANHFNTAIEVVDDSSVDTKK